MKKSSQKSGQNRKHDRKPAKGPTVPELQKQVLSLQGRLGSLTRTHGEAVRSFCVVDRQKLHLERQVVALFDLLGVALNAMDSGVTHDVAQVVAASLRADLKALQAEFKVIADVAKKATQQTTNAADRK